MTTEREQPRAAAGEGLTPASRQRRSRRLRLVLASIVALMLLGGSAGYAGARYGWTPQLVNEDRGGAWSWVGLSLTVIGLGLEAWGLVRGWRSGSLATAWNSPLHNLSRKSRIGLRHQVLGRRPLDPDRIPQAREFAGAMIRNYERSVPIVGGLSVMALGQALQRAGLFWPICWLATALMLIIGLISGRHDRSTAHAFLAAHPAPAP